MKSPDDLHFILRPARGKPQGLLVLLHGVGGNEHGLASLAEEQDPGIVVVVPRGPLALGSASFGWYQVNFGPTGPVLNAEQAESSRVALLGFIANQQASLGLTPSQTVVAGFSQGGIMSASIALTSPASVGAFGILSGRILTEIDPLIPDNVATYPIEGLVMHGRIDPVLPFSHAEASVRRLESLGVVHTLLAYDNVDHGLSNTMRNDFRDWVDKQIARAG
jgi:phospholipase/carboxylesterase